MSSLLKDFDPLLTILSVLLAIISSNAWSQTALSLHDKLVVAALAIGLVLAGLTFMSLMDILKAKEMKRF